MKKFIATLLALVMVLSMAACGNNDTADNTTDAPSVDAPADTPVEDNSAQDMPADDPVEETPTDAPVADGAAGILETIWNLHGEDQKFSAMGGDMNNLVDGKPGKFDHTDVENLSYQLLVPAEQIANIDDAAGLFHGMMLNNFTAGAFHVTGDAQTFADAMYGAITGNQWMCGFPEQMLIAVVDGEYVVMVYGLADLVNNFATHMAAAYPNAQVLYNEAIVA